MPDAVRVVSALVTATSLFALGNITMAGEPLRSIDTGYTITKIRSAQRRGAPYIVCSSHEGTLLGFAFDDKRLWSNALCGFMNRDVWCADINGDGSDEVLAANADGALYCLDSEGRTRWTFQPGEAPMSAVCTVTKDGITYVVCGSYDRNLYYLTPEGKTVKTIASKVYSVAKPWGKHGHKRFPEPNRHIPNFIRPTRGANGLQILVVHGTHNSNANPGSLYLFEPLTDTPFHTISKVAGSNKPFGDLHISDINGDGIDEISLGTSTSIQQTAVVRYDLKDYSTHDLDLSKYWKELGGNGYRVAQPVMIGPAGDQRMLVLLGHRMIVASPSFAADSLEFLECRYSFNDLWRDSNSGMLLLASAQSGGSCVHVLDTTVTGWRDAYTSLQPPGKLRAILDNTAAARRLLQSYSPPSNQRKHQPVYMMSEKLEGEGDDLARSLESTYGSPIFLQSLYMRETEDWDRATVRSEAYRKKRDRRRQYTLTQEQALERIRGAYDADRSGAAFWGGHGNDPHMLSTDTMFKAAEYAASKGESSVFMYPELEAWGEDFGYVLEDHFYPMAERFQGTNARLYIRTKHAFWQSIVYLPIWSRLLSGEFADVFVPSMEETTDKTMEQSVAGRVGIWASGAVNQWGSRGARDNASFDRLRQHSHQMIPNHFLRTQIYNIAYGATYQNNYPVNQDYFSILYELIAKGVLYVPERNEIVSFSPVHLSMTEPDAQYLDYGNNVKWLTFYDAEFERDNPMVFSRLDGTWPGAPVTEWDFSRYAAGVRERRLNFLPPYSNGLVLITPPQNGVFAHTDAPRGKLLDHLHPLYRDIMQEYITDGRHYLSADGGRTFSADTYYHTVARSIAESAEKLPLTVSGNVAWACAQTAPEHLRLTLVDSGYLNPGDKTADVSFHTVIPAKVTDILSGKTFDLAEPGHVDIPVPCGLFRFLEITLKEPL